MMCKYFNKLHFIQHFLHKKKKGNIFLKQNRLSIWIISWQVFWNSLAYIPQCTVVRSFSFVSWILSLLNSLKLIVQAVVKTDYSREDKTQHETCSSLRVHDEGFEVRVQIRHKGADKVLDGRSFLQHAWTWNKRGKLQLRTLSFSSTIFLL